MLCPKRPRVFVIMMDLCLAIIQAILFSTLTAGTKITLLEVLLNLSRDFSSVRFPTQHVTYCQICFRQTLSPRNKKTHRHRLETDSYTITASVV
jgi:hypothetical protein